MSEKQLTVQEYRFDKQVTEKAIAEILNKFQDKYSVGVRQIDILHVATIGDGDKSRIQDVVLDVKL